MELEKQKIAETEEKKIELPIITRRILNQSGESLVISLPSQWLKEKKLVKGDKVILIANGNLTVHKEGSELNKKISDSLKEINP